MVAELAAAIERIDGPEEAGDQAGIADPGGIVDDPHHLDMAGAAGGDLLVGRVGDRPPE